MSKTLAQQIEETAASLRQAKPRSEQRIRLEYKLRDLVTRQLKKEIKAGHHAAAE
jgi:hypothetical protein